MNIGAAIRRLRKSKTSLNQSDFAKAIGITQTYLSQIETGNKTPSTQVLYDIGNYLKMPLPILFWFSITEEDIQGTKLEHFKFLKPSIDAMIDSII